MHCPRFRRDKEKITNTIIRSCTLCRKRKIKCNRELPCNNCLRSKKSTCEYVDHSPPPRQRARQRQTEPSLEHSPEEPRGWLHVSPSSHITGGTQIQQASVSTAPHSTAPNTPTSQSSAREADLLNKIKQLETQLAKARGEPAASVGPSPIWDSSIDAPQIAGTFHVNREAPSEGKAPTIVRTIMHKTRVFGQSHWIHGVTQVCSSYEESRP